MDAVADAVRLRIIRSTVTIVALLVAATGRAVAQDPVKLPGVSVKAAADLPGKRLLTGIVVDTAGNTIPGVEISIPDLQRRLYSRDDGTFRFDSIPRGKYSMRARKIGFAPQIREFVVDTAGGVASFQLLPLAQALPAIVSVSSRIGLSGVVGDTAFKPVAGAVVRVLGGGMGTPTDSLGTFFLPVHSGKYMVSIIKEGFATRLVSVTIPSDSGRRITAWLRPTDAAQSVDEKVNREQLRYRLAWISPGGMSGVTVYTREELLEMKIEWIFDAVRMTGSKNNATEPYSPNCVASINGGPATAKLSTITIDDVELVEVYGSGGGSRRAVSFGMAKQGSSPPITVKDNGRNASLGNHGLSCPQVIVWTR